MPTPRTTWALKSWTRFSPCFQCPRQCASLQRTQTPLITFCGRRIFSCAASTLKTTVFRLHSANIGMDRFQPVLRACAVNALSFLARRALAHARVDPSSNPHSHSSAAAPPPWFYAIHSDALSAELDAHPTADSTLPILPTRVRFAAQLAHFETAPVSDPANVSTSSTAIRPLPCAQGTVLV